MSDDLVARFAEFQDAIGGCTDGYCVIRALIKEDRK